MSSHTGNVTNIEEISQRCMPLRYGSKTGAVTSATNFQTSLYPSNTEQVERKNRALSSSNGEKADLKTAYNQHLRKISNQNSREASNEDLPTYKQSKQVPAFDAYITPGNQNDHV